MHPSSYDKMAGFRERHLTGREAESLLILDLGSQDINGSYRPLFDEARWQYRGVDMAAGKNVDIVLSEPYSWREIAANSADIIVSGQTFEHTEFFWLTMEQIARALKPNGLCCILAPSSGPEHQYPVDCWRVYPDGFRAVARHARLEVVECWTQWEDLPQYDDESNKWHDSLLVARKPAEQPEPPQWTFKQRLAASLLRLLGEEDAAGSRSRTRVIGG
ncbi:MAG: methyltransferase domain-containing protein [Chthoniobacterales bacterium]|nr:methyltransferase domain-containing protein [Chthoniobacterales bacterium]